MSTETNRSNYLIEIGIPLVFLLILIIYFIYSVIIQENVSSLPAIILFIIIALISLLGYIFILFPQLVEKIKAFYLTSIVNELFLTLIPFLFVVFVFLIITTVPELSILPSSEFVPEFSKYIFFVLVPIILSLFYRYYLKKSNHFVIRLFCGWIIIYFIWWTIEFEGKFYSISPLIPSFDLFKLLAIILATWVFFLMIDYQVPRSFARLFQVQVLKTIIFWLFILFIIILPLGLLTSFLSFDLSNILGNLGEKLLAIVPTFIAIYLITALIEEFLFRGILYRWTLKQLEEISQDVQTIIIILFFAFVGLLLILTPFLGLADTIQAGLVKGVPLEIIYPLIGLIYFSLGLLWYFKTKNIMFTMIVWSSMLFGWAHFEDWRYIIFATIAGIGYCSTFQETDNIFASAIVHASVNTIWGIFL